jgi:hypothetical protein
MVGDLGSGGGDEGKNVRHWRSSSGARWEAGAGSIALAMGNEIEKIVDKESQ